MQSAPLVSIKTAIRVWFSNRQIAQEKGGEKGYRKKMPKLKKMLKFLPPWVVLQFFQKVLSLHKSS
jgi:hypothetical protein